MKYIDIVFDDFPGPEGARLIEVEDHRGRSITIGTWLYRSDGSAALRIEMDSDNADVLAFQEKFDIPMSPVPAFLDDLAYKFRTAFMHEELAEFMTACSQRDLAGAADALVDLVYVAHGTALMMGLPWKKLWDEVQRANMSKERATDVSQTKRKSTLDVIKPPDWKAPDHTQALENQPAVGSFFDTSERIMVLP